MEFRNLRADEIECRVNSISEKGCSLLLYKDARADMNLLDETVGPENWQRSHEVINGSLFCSVGIYANEEWVFKQDVGTESNTEAEKGQASDAFKRACVNWGIGRELYTAPFIWISNVNVEKNDKGKWSTKERFKVSSIHYDDRRNIDGLTIENNKHQIVYKLGEKMAEEEAEDETIQTSIAEVEARAKVMAYLNKVNMSKDNIEKICSLYKVESINNMSLGQCKHYLALVEQKGTNNL